MKGLVLEGGGAKGSYHIGAYKAILEEGIAITGITGTSIGAINGAMIVQGDFQLCYELWKDISYSKVIKAEDEEIDNLLYENLEKEDLLELGRKLKKLIKQRGFDITPLKKILSKYIKEEKIRNSPMDFGIVTVNLSDFKSEELFIEDIPKGELQKYLLASSYLPVFKRERLGGKIYLDGAFYDNLPFNLLSRKGYKDLILVRTHAPGLTRKIEGEDLKFTIIEPSEDIGKTYEYNAKGARNNIELGYYDGLKALRGLLGKTYYIKEESEDYFLDYLLSIEEEKIKEISNILNCNSMPGKRLLLESIIPKLAKMIDLNSDFTYKDLLVELLEIKAKAVSINRYRIYSFKELLELIKSKDRVREIDKNIRHAEVIGDIIDLSTRFNKDEIILQIGDIIFGG